MHWIVELTWWQWVLLALANSFLGYWAGVGTLCAWHNLRLRKLWNYAEEDVSWRGLSLAFVLWPIAVLENILKDSCTPPFSMSMPLNTYLMWMMAMGPLPKIASAAIALAITTSVGIIVVVSVIFVFVGEFMIAVRSWYMQCISRFGAILRLIKQ